VVYVGEVVDLDQAREICEPYGLRVERGYPFSFIYFEYVAYGPHDLGGTYSFLIHEDMSAEELDKLALTWSIENSFAPST
jgi:hypothetical protein